MFIPFALEEVRSPSLFILYHGCVLFAQNVTEALHKFELNSGCLLREELHTYSLQGRLLPADYLHLQLQGSDRLGSIPSLDTLFLLSAAFGRDMPFYYETFSCL